MASTSFSQGTLVLRVDLCEGYGGARLPVDQAALPGLVLDDAVGNPHLAAQGGQEDHELDGIHIMRITTSWAFLFSTRVVTVLTPARRIGGLLVGTSPLPAAFFSARASSLCFFSRFVSGLYLWASLSS